MEEPYVEEASKMMNGRSRGQQDTALGCIPILKRREAAYVWEKLAGTLCLIAGSPKFIQQITVVLCRTFETTENPIMNSIEYWT